MLLKDQGPKMKENVGVSAHWSALNNKTLYNGQWFIKGASAQLWPPSFNFLCSHLKWSFEVMLWMNVVFQTKTLCFNINDLWRLENPALKWCDVVACSTSTVGQVKAAVQLIISVLHSPASGFGWVFWLTGIHFFRLVKVVQHPAASYLHQFTGCNTLIYTRHISTSGKPAIRVHSQYYALVQSTSISQCS